MDFENLSSSPDPIFILQDSPTSARSRRLATPLKPRNTNTCSPSKSVILDALDPDGKSPWRIKVTVEAEPSGSPVKINRRVTRSTTVPLKTGDETPQVRRRGRPRKSEANQPTSSTSSTMNTGRTPPRKGKTPARVSAPEPPANQSVAARPSVTRRSSRRARRTLLAEGSKEEEVVMQPSKSIVTETASSRGQRSFSPSPSTNNAEDEEQEHPVFVGEDADLNDRDFEPAAPGDVTTFENEEFSMISVDSLSSHTSGRELSMHKQATMSRTAQPERTDVTISYMPSSPPVLRRSIETPQITETPQQPPKKLQPVINFPHVLTPMRESVVRSGKVLQDIVRSPDVGRSRLQDDRSPNGLFAGFSADTRRELRQSLQLGADMQAYESCSKSPLAHLSSSSGIHYPTIKDVVVDHRLPTPDERELEAPRSDMSNAPVAYQAIFPNTPEHSSPAIGKSSYDMMSWAPTGPARLSSPLKPIQQVNDAQDLPKPIGSSVSNAIAVPSDCSESESEEEEENDDEDLSEEEQTHTAAQGYRGVIAPSSPTHGDDRDIWQEEASRSIESVHENEDEARNEISALFDAPVVPKRSKLPGTWRRASGNHFHYSDSPEPEEIPERKSNSSGSSRQSSGVATPPSADDDDEQRNVPNPTEEEMMAMEVEDEDLESEQDVPTPATEGESVDGEDTGLFWHSNLPNVFQGRRRVQQGAETSMVSELRPMSSPLKSSTSSTRSLRRLPLQMRKVEGAVHSSVHSSSLLSSPLRKSLLKSSKVASSPLGKQSSAASSIVDEQHDESDVSAVEESLEELSISEDIDEPSHLHDVSMASNDRQLLAELVAHNRRQSINAADLDPTQTTFRADSTQPDESTFETTYLGKSRSYIENLNRESPTKIAVKFNDSSVLTNSILPPSIPDLEVQDVVNTTLLSPKKKYASLFEDHAPLGGRDTSSSQVGLGIDNEDQAAETQISVSQQTKPGLVSKMTSSFWSAVSTKAPPTPLSKVSFDTSAASLPVQAVVAPTSKPQYRQELAQPTISDSVLRLRRKYGLLSPVHPFTMAHARTLHRLWNSVAQHPTTTLVPISAPVPSHLVSQEKRVYASPTTNTTLVINDAHLATVAAFQSLLVGDEERTRLESQGGFGDELAVKSKGWDSRGRHGSWFAFAGEGRGDKEARALRGVLEGGFLVECLAEIVIKEGRRGR